MRSSTIRRLAALAILLLACNRAEQSDEIPVGASPDVANRVTSRNVVLFFEGPAALLVPETRALPLPESESAALHPVLAALVAGSSNASVPKLFPDDTVLRGAFLLPDGTAVVDLGGPTLQAGWTTGSRSEMLAAYAIVQTAISNFRGIRQVQILVGGEVAQTLAGHLDLTRPLKPAAYLVEQPLRRDPQS